MADLKQSANRTVLVWAINQVGFTDSFTGDALDVRDAVTFEARLKGSTGGMKLYVVTGETYDKIRDVLEAKYELVDVIDGRTL